MGVSTYSALSDLAYFHSMGIRDYAPIFEIQLRKPVGVITETLFISSLTVDTAKFGTNGRFMDIIYEQDKINTETEPTTP